MGIGADTIRRICMEYARSDVRCRAIYHLQTGSLIRHKSFARALEHGARNRLLIRRRKPLEEIARQRLFGVLGEFEKLINPTRRIRPGADARRYNP